MQVVVRNSEMVDYEKKTVMLVQVWFAKMLWDTEVMGNQAPVSPLVLLSLGCGH